MSTIVLTNNTESKKNTNSEIKSEIKCEIKSEISKTFFENNDEINSFFDKVGESLKSLPSVSSNSETESNISSAELKEIEEFMELYVEKSNLLRSISEENIN